MTTIADGSQDLGEMGEPTTDSLHQVGLEPPRPPEPAPAAPSSDLFVSLHVDSPVEGWGQQSNEAVFIGYARVPVTRGSLIEALISSVSVRFPDCKGGGLNVVTHIGIGTDPTGPGRLICSWRLSSSVAVSNGIMVSPWLEPHLISNWRSELGLDEPAPVRERTATPAPIERARPNVPASVEPMGPLAPLTTRMKEVLAGVTFASMCFGFGFSVHSLIIAPQRTATDGLEHVARMIRDSHEMQRASDAFVEARLDDIKRTAQRAEEAARRAERAARRVNTQEARRSR